MDPEMNFSGVFGNAADDLDFVYGPQSMPTTYHSLNAAFSDADQPAQDWSCPEDDLSELEASGVLLEVANADVDPNISDFQSASSAMSSIQQSATASPFSSTEIQQPGTLTSQQVSQHLQSARLNVVQPAVTLFQTAESAKQWRKRGQNQPVPNINDTEFPQSPAEQREYIHLLKAAFEYIGDGCKYTKQERLFLTKQRTQHCKMEIESWCWQLLGEIMRRQLHGRPSESTKLKHASLDPEVETFAQRFSAVYNALKFEKRCCIRFANMAAWHKRLANDPKTEVAELQKNDSINEKRAKKIAEAKGVAKSLKDGKAKETKRKRDKEDDQSGYSSESASTSGFGSTDTMPATILPFHQSQAESIQPMHVGEPTTRKRNLPKGVINSSQSKRVKLDNRPAAMTRRSSGVNTVYKDDLRSSLTHRLSEVRRGPTYEDLLAVASDAVNTHASYGSSTSANTFLGSNSNQYRPQMMVSPFTTEQAMQPFVQGYRQEEYPSLDQSVAGDPHFQGN
jgi:hypothetical protein